MILPEIGPVDGRTRAAVFFREVAGAIANERAGRAIGGTAWSLHLPAAR